MRKRISSHPATLRVVRSGPQRLWPLACASVCAVSVTATKRGAISVEPRINDRIRVPEVRPVGPNGEQVGIVRIDDALRLARRAISISSRWLPSPGRRCKLMDYGKFGHESAQKDRAARRNQAQTVIKEMKLRPKIDPHDYDTKKGHIVRFLNGGDKVKVTIMFRGREQSRPELGFRLLQRLAEDIEDIGFVEYSPKQEGRNMIMVIAPLKKKSEVKGTRSQQRRDRDRRDAERDGADTGRRGPRGTPCRR